MGDEGKNLANQEESILPQIGKGREPDANQSPILKISAKANVYKETVATLKDPCLR